MEAEQPDGTEPEAPDGPHVKSRSALPVALASMSQTSVLETYGVVMAAARQSTQPAPASTTGVAHEPAAVGSGVAAEQ